MPKWMLKLVLTLTCLGLFSATAWSQNPFQKVRNWYQNMKSQFDLDVKRNNAWPQPFAVEDQLRVQQTFAPMLVQGAALNRILDSVHFDPKTHELNNAGRTHLRVILQQQKPLDILVASTMDPETDKARQEKLTELLSQYSFDGPRPGVSTTFYLPHHKSAFEQADIRQRYIQALRQPTIDSVQGRVSGSTQQ